MDEVCLVNQYIIGAHILLVEVLIVFIHSFPQFSEHLYDYYFKVLVNYLSPFH